MITTISDYIKSKLEGGATPQELADMCNISTAMVSKYKADIGYKPSLAVAVAIYKADGVVLHPFAEESLNVEAQQ